MNEGRRTIAPRLRRAYKNWSLALARKVSNEEIARPKQSGSVTNRTRGFVPAPASQSPKKPSAQARDELDSRSVRVVLDFQQFIAKWSSDFGVNRIRSIPSVFLVKELGGMAANKAYGDDVAMKDICFFRFLTGISQLKNPGDFLNDFLNFVSKHELTMGDLLILTTAELER